MSRRRDDRRWRAAGRQHDTIVQQNTRRARGEPWYLAASVSEFLAAGETFCPGNHTADESCDSEE